MSDWTDSHVAVRDADGSFLVDAWVSADAPGLAVTRTLGGNLRRGDGAYTVTHRDSGCRVTSCTTLDAAQAEAVRLAQLTDWTVDADVLRGSAILASAAQRAERAGAA